MLRSWSLRARPCLRVKIRSATKGSPSLSSSGPSFLVFPLYPHHLGLKCTSAWGLSENQNLPFFSGVTWGWRRGGHLGRGQGATATVRIDIQAESYATWLPTICFCNLHKTTFPGAHTLPLEYANWVRDSKRTWENGRIRWVFGTFFFFF